VFNRAHWVVADQMLISGTNFVTMLLLARGLSPSHFGIFTVVYSGLLFANGLQGALICVPHNVLGAALRGEAYARYTTSTAVSQVLVSVAVALLVLAVGAFAHAAVWDVAPLLVALAPSIVAWQLREFVRRVLYTEGRVAGAFANDIISYGGQTLVIATLWARDALTGPAGLYALAATSALAAGLGGWQLRHSLRGHVDRAAIRENWHFGKWLAGAEILEWLSSVYMYQYLTAFILGPAATGMLKGAQIVLGPTRMLALALDTVLPTRLAQTLAQSGKQALHAQLKATLLVVVPPIASYCLLVAVFADPVLRLLYGDRYAGAAGVLRLYAVHAFLGYLLQILCAGLKAKRLSRAVFRGYVYSSLVAGSLGWLFIKALGTEGALVGMILTCLIAHLLVFLAYRHGPVIEGCAK
jgi:O-antigen/teichoic acid export membrane protein